MKKYHSRVGFSSYVEDDPVQHRNQSDANRVRDIETLFEHLLLCLSRRQGEYKIWENEEAKKCWLMLKQSSDALWIHEKVIIGSVIRL